MGRKLPLHHLHNIGGNTNTKTLNGANTKTLNGEITNGEITSVKKVMAAMDIEENVLLCKSYVAATLQCSCTFVDFCSQISRTDVSECRARDEE